MYVQPVLTAIAMESSDFTSSLYSHINQLKYVRELFWERFMGYSGEKSSFTCGSPFMCCICSRHHRGPQNLKLVGPPRTASPMRCVPFKFALFGQLAPSPPFGGVHIQMYTYRRTHTGVNFERSSSYIHAPPEGNISKRRCFAHASHSSAHAYSLAHRVQPNKS